MRRRTVGGLVALATLGLAALAVVATGSAAHKQKQAPIKAAWILVAPHNDGGWNQAHNRGRLYVQKQMGANVITTYKENVPEGPQASQVIDSLVRDGNKIIFADSFGYKAAMVAAAKKYPNVYFEHATGDAVTKNLANYFGASEDTIYLSGLAAGAATKKGVVGYILPFPFAEMIRHANAFTLGVQETHPGTKVKVVYTNSFFDPAKEKKASEGRSPPGPTWSGRTSMVPRQVRPPGGRRSVGRLQQQLAEVRADVMADGVRLRLGNLLPQARQGGGKRHLEDRELLRQHQGRLHRHRAVRPKVSAKTKALIAKRKAQIVAGTFYEFTGPLVDQSGKVRVPKGKRMTLPEILKFDWFVKGIQGSPKG